MLAYLQIVPIDTNMKRGFQTDLAAMYLSRLHPGYHISSSLSFCFALQGNIWENHVTDRTLLKAVNHFNQSLQNEWDVTAVVDILLSFPLGTLCFRNEMGKCGNFPQVGNPPKPISYLPNITQNGTKKYLYQIAPVSNIFCTRGPIIYCDTWIVHHIYMYCHHPVNTKAFLSWTRNQWPRCRQNEKIARCSCCCF